MKNLLFKFCSGGGAVKILENNSIFITSPLDFNDPFEMRPAWTQAHEERYAQDTECRLRAVSGVLPGITSHKPTPVEHQYGTADGHNGEVFRLLHGTFRVLCLSKGVLDVNENGDSDCHSTLMWSHYADQFQGICLGLDVAQFNNGLERGGFPVRYEPQRKSIPESYYDTWQSIERVSHSGYQPDPASSGLFLTEKQRSERKLHHCRDLLTFKSPAWSYEKEVRMIYDLPFLNGSREYSRIPFSCRECQQSGINPEQCSHDVHKTYRDAISLPPAAIRAVIFGTDCLPDIVERVIEVLSSVYYTGVDCYWSSYPSSRYAVKYKKADQNYIRMTQMERATAFAYAKEHRSYDGKSERPRIAARGINFLNNRIRTQK